jgi:hypothetical protein
MTCRVQSCLEANGGHFQRMLWCRHISHTMNELLFKFHCTIIIGVRIIKEMPGLIGSGTPCTCTHARARTHTHTEASVNTVNPWVCRPTFCTFSQYIFSLSIFVIKNKHLYNTNNQIHSVHTRFKTNLHPPIANLTKFERAVYYSEIKIFNNLPYDIKDLANEITLFRNALKRFLLINSFYNSKEYFNYQR